MAELFTNLHYSLTKPLARKIELLTFKTGRNKSTIVRSALFTFFSLTERQQLAALEDVELIYGRDFLVPRRWTKRKHSYLDVKSLVRMHTDKADMLIDSINLLIVKAYPIFKAKLSVQAIIRCAIVHSLKL